MGRVGGLSQNFYQRSAYGRGGARNYDHIFLLFPETQSLVEKAFRQGGTMLFVRQLDPRTIRSPAA